MGNILFLMTVWGWFLYLLVMNTTLVLPTPIFYGMPKIHKTPMKLCQVVSCINSFPAIFSTWLDYKMKQLLHLIPSYLKDTKTLLDKIKDLHIPPNAKLFTADTISMYMNISTLVCLHALQQLFTTNKNRIPSNFP